tara:strand:+ start:39 stop:893 length:855 start_codon:yes stop_codon:yes gene_type:complete
MSPRNNEARVSSGDAEPASTPVPESPATDPLSFVTPTEFVDLPSRGEFYSQGHPLHMQDTVEIRFMTAKDEDILTSRTLLKKGLAIERLLQNIIVNKTIKPAELLLGDRNAILIAARATGYGSEYTTNINCPSCGQYVEYTFDLGRAEVTYPADEESSDITRTNDGTFVIRIPKMGLDVETRLLTGRDEANLSKVASSRKKHNLEESLLTDQFKQFVVSVNGETGKDIINSFIENMPAYDSRFLRFHYQAIVPNVDLTQTFECSSCELEQQMEVPFTADFFWVK